jgi:hypothetical protein
MSPYLTFKILSIYIMLVIPFDIFIARRTSGEHDYMPSVASGKKLFLISKRPGILVNFLLPVFLLFVIASCGNGSRDTKSTCWMITLVNTVSNNICPCCEYL